MRFKSTYFGNIHKQVTQSDGKTVIRGVVIIQAGVDKCGDYIDEEFLKELTTQGNTKDGVKCRFGHPTMCKESLGSYLGKYKNFSVISDGGTMKVIADLELDEVSKDTPQGNLHDYVVKMATQNPDTFGNSIVCMADTEPFKLGDQDVQRLVMKKFMESDLVDSPAATESLFKDSTDIGVILTDFLDENPEVFDAISKDVSTIEIFFKKYANYATQKNKSINMSFLKSIQNMFKTQKDIDVTTADGTILTVVTDANQPAVGDKVNIAGAAAPDAEYLMPDGGTIVTVAGAITEIESASTEATPEPGETEEVEKAVNAAVEAMTKSLTETFTKSMTEFTEKMNGELSELRDSIQYVAKQTSSQFTPPVEKNDGTEENKKEKSNVQRTPLSDLK